MSHGNMVNADLRGFLSGLTQTITDDRHSNEQPTIGPGPLMPTDLPYHRSVIAKTTLMDWSLIIGPMADHKGNIYYEVRPHASESLNSAIDIINHWWSNLPDGLHSEWNQIVNIRNSNPYTNNSAHGYWSYNMDIGMIQHVREWSTMGDLTFISMYQVNKPVRLPVKPVTQDSRGSSMLTVLKSLAPIRVYRLVNPKLK